MHEFECEWCEDEELVFTMEGKKRIFVTKKELDERYGHRFVDG